MIKVRMKGYNYLIEVTSHPRAEAALQILEPRQKSIRRAANCLLDMGDGNNKPRNPLPPATTIFFFTAVVEAMIVV